jgi:ubiquinone/menaquinone biosynthesis C-methylase UbiE
MHPATGEEFDDAVLAGVNELLQRHLGERNPRTVAAYTQDLQEFARYLDRPVVAAVAQLLAGGAAIGRQLMLDYAWQLRTWGRAPATISRRLAALRGLVRTARTDGLTDWLLEVPGEDEFQAGDVVAPTTESRHYLLPRHISEIDRLDVQHYAIRSALDANYRAPIGTPARVLDVGSGTGQWGFEMAEEFPGSLVVGLDLVSGKRERPPGYQAIRGNVLRGLPFADEAFDFVHQRLMFLAIPLAAWPAVVRDLARVTRPEGWVELVEGPALRLDNAGPAIEHLRDLTLEIAKARGLDTSSTVADSLDDFLRQADLRNVEREEVRLPVGEWGGQVGSLLATDFAPRSPASWRRAPRSRPRSARISSSGCSRSTRSAGSRSPWRSRSASGDRIIRLRAGAGHPPALRRRRRRRPDADPRERRHAAGRRAAGRRAAAGRAAPAQPRRLGPRRRPRTHGAGA